MRTTHPAWPIAHFQLPIVNSQCIVIFPLLCLALLAGSVPPVIAASTESETSEAKDKEAAKESGAEKAAAKSGKPIPKEECSATHHQVKIGDRDIPYTAKAGNLLIRNGDDPVASVFYAAYTRDQVTNVDHRPVTFFYNGGPGSSTIWLHMGSFGPRIVETANAQPTGPAPYHVVHNGDSLLDRSDLVFIDAVGTGFSRIVGKGEGTRLLGRGRGRGGFREVHHALRHGEPSLELAQVPVRRVLRHAALGCARLSPAEPGDAASTASCCSLRS